MTLRHSQTAVAIDLGSNSFHLLEASLDDSGRLQPLTALARKIQLGLGMTPEGMTQAAIDRGLACLHEFAPFCRELGADRVRVVGTQALRRAGNRDHFLTHAESILGHPVEIISGEQEARLAYLGVVSAVDGEADLLVADIGGGSTELVAGRGDHPQQLASLHLGCVSWLRYFPGGRIDNDALQEAIVAARKALDPVAPDFVGDWYATGCSGTLLAVAEVLQRQGWADGHITRAGLEQLQRALLDFDCIEAVHFQGLSEDRRSIFASGVAIVIALFDSLQLSHMALSQRGLREGVAWELLRE